MAEEPPHLDEGSSAAPGISPGLVGDNEYLLRELYLITDVDEIGGELKERAIPATHLVSSGFSVLRQDHVGAPVVEALIAERTARSKNGPPRTSIGVSQLQTCEVRDLRLQNQPDKQAFVVIDTATDERPFHASIYAAKPNAKDSHGRRLRKLLLPLLEEKRMGLNDAYKGGSSAQNNP